MDINKYIDLLKNTIRYELPGYNLQDVINRLVTNKVATYKESDGIKLKISSDKPKQDRILECLEKRPEDTIFHIEKMYIEKGYRYSIYYKCNNFRINDNYDEYNDFTNYNPISLNNGEIEDFLKPILFQNDKEIIFKFIKIINPYYTKIDKSEYIMYPTLWIYHKNLKILEHRFDSLSFKSDDDFYSKTKDAQINILKKISTFEVEEFRTSKLIDEIINQNKNEVSLKGQDIGLKGNSSAKLKVGTNNVMPFIGDLEEIIEKNKSILFADENSEKITKIFSDYIDEVKKEAKYKSRLIEISTDNELKINVAINVFFSYRDNNYDLYNFLECKKIDMEMMNNAIKYIFKFYENKQNIR